jgi:PAS domain S-box-containing protein
MLLLEASPAMEVTLSRKRAKSRTQAQAKARVGRARKTRADLEQELKVCRRKLAKAHERLAEVAMQQTATSGMLRLISNSHIQSVLDAIAENAARLCDANNAEIFRLEDNLLRLAASYGEIPVVIHAYQGVPVNRDTVTGRAACDRQTIHVHDLAAEEGEYPVGSSNAKREGHRTTLATPLLREGTLVGIILIRRMEVRPFYDEQIALIETFADQAVIAIENVRLYNELREREARIRRLVDSNIIGIFIGDSRGRIIEANDAFLEILGYGHDDVVSGRMRWTKLTPAEWAPADENALAQLSVTGTCRPYEKEYCRKDGSRVPVLVGGAFFERETDEGVVFVIDMSERKRAEEALREREIKIRRLVDSNIIGIFIWDFDGRIVEANDEFLRMVNYDREDLVSDRIRWADLTPPDWRDRNNSRIERQKTSGRFEPFEKEYTRKDGSRVPVLIGGATFEDGGNQGVAFVLDLTERKCAEQALREREAQLAGARRELRQMIDTIPIPLASYSENYRRDFVNAAWKQYTGLSDEAALGSEWSVVAHPDHIAAGEKMWHDAVATGEPWHTEERVRRADGQYRWFAIDRVAARDENGRIIKWYGTAYDIEDRKRAEDALRESEYKLRQIIETVPGLLWSTDPDGKLTHVNQRFLDYSGMRFEDFQQGGWEPLLRPDDYAEIARTFYHAIHTGTSYQDVMRLRRADGEFRWHHVRGEPLRDREGRIIQWYGLSVDIDEAKKAEGLLRRSEAYLAEAQRLSHCGVTAYKGAKVFYGSEEIYRIWGFDPAQGIPSRKAVLQRIHPDDLDGLNAEVECALGEKRRYSVAYRIVLPDGTVKHLESIGQPVFSTNGELVEVVATQIDVTERKRSEQALRESEARLVEARRELQATIDKIPALVASLWPNGERDFVNLTWQRFTGISQEEARGTTQMIPVHPDHRGLDASHWQRCLETGEPFEEEEQLLRVDGQYRWHWVRREPARDENGKVIKWYGIGFDIEDRKRAEDALRESETKFRDYAETASDWFWEIGPDYKFTLLTENAFSAPAAHRLGTFCWDHALDLEAEPEKWQLIRATLDSRQPFRDFVYRGLSGNGSPMYVRASGKPMFDANGEFRGYRGTGTDVTAIMRAQEALRESERSARSTIDGIAGLVAVLAPNGEVETVNRQCLEYFGRSLEEQKNWQLTDMVHPEDLPHMLEVFKRAIASEIPYQFEQRLRRSDGEYRWFDTRGGAVRDDTGRIVRWYVLLTDIEDRKRALARLEQMQLDFAHINRVSMMGELVASLSHEITQPIASAHIYAAAAQNFLNMQPPDLAEVREALAGIVDNADRAGDIIGRVRDQIRKAPPRKERFDLNSAIDEVIGLGRSAIINNRVWVQTRLSEGLFPVHGDRVQLQQVVLNLLLNAVEAMGSVEAAPRDLLISTTQDHTGVVVAVQDSGPGIDLEHLERVFDSFYTTKPGGTGMGLSICRSIVDAHGGRLWAAANEPRGAIFQFTLPAG